ncbi:MAG: hypothetical protein QGH39_02615, partial [Candidatus Thermoplasmatota archaeon]|nr:hypothetical protein [Candidatus Thermoplasmatota archaeon]
ILISTDAMNGNGEWKDGKVWLSTGQGAQGYGNPVAKVPVVNQGAGFSLKVYNFDDEDRDDFVLGYSWDTNADKVADRWEIRIYTINNQGAFGLEWSDNTGPQGTLNGKVGRIWADDFDNSGAGDVLYSGEDLRLLDIRTGYEADRTPPAAITDLAVSQPQGMNDDTVKLAWSGPGDDENSGGPPAYYIIHYADFAINLGNFNTTTNASNAPKPTGPGNTETVQIDQLDSSTTYYFAIRTVDDAGNWAPLSNVVSFGIPDYVDPDSISDLTASYISVDGEIELSWTAPGDDEDTGTVNSYLVGFSDTNILSFDSVTLINTGLPTPQAAGVTESMRIDINSTAGLDFDETNYYAVIAKDEADNEGGLSNVVSVKLPDITSPDAVSLVAASGDNDGEIKISWQATGDDGGTGKADSYEMRYSSTVFTADDYDNAAQVTGLPAPGNSGSSEEFVMTGLTGGTSYYFAMKVFDDALNPSVISNVASALATDATAPAKITGIDLADTPGDNGGSLSLTWSISPSTDFQSYRIYISSSEMTSPDEDNLIQEIDDINTSLYNITKIGGKVLTDGTEYHVGITAVDTTGNEGVLGTASAASPVDDLAPKIRYFHPSKVSLKLEADSEQTFNITEEFYDDETRDIKWYED